MAKSQIKHRNCISW